MRMPTQTKTLLLLPNAPQWELAILAVLNRLEMWSARRLDRINELRRPRTRQKRGRIGETPILLYHAVAPTHRSVFVRISARPTRRHVEECPSLVPRPSGHSTWVATLLRRRELAGRWFGCLFELREQSSDQSTDSYVKRPGAGRLLQSNGRTRTGCHYVGECQTKYCIDGVFRINRVSKGSLYVLIDDLKISQSLCLMI